MFSKRLKRIYEDVFQNFYVERLYNLIKCYDRSFPFAVVLTSF